MSTPDQPETTPLTRRRLREIRATGATPVIPPPSEDEPEQAPADLVEPEPVAPAPSPAPISTPLPRAAEPAPLAPAPLPDTAVDLGVTALTRRQARAQERIRTASVPVIHPDAVPAASAAAVPPATDAPTVVPPAEDADSTAGQRDDSVGEAVASDAGEEASTTTTTTDDAAVEALTTPREEETPAPAFVNPQLGSELLAGETPAVSIPPSFDQLIARGTSATGSVATPNALILSQTPSAAPLAPISATGEVLITGSFDLPAGLGSVGHAHGTTDGKDLDAALIDGELPPSSSPTPIAASAAISTARHSGEEIIRPPAPEKGNRLMLALVITAGVLALALVGVLILAVTTGVFA